MGRIDLTELPRREGEQIEWKENVADIDDVVATLVASANDLQNSPPITPPVEELTTEDEQRRILVLLQPSTGGAHSFRKANEGAKHFVHVSSFTIEARNGILKSLLVRKCAMEPWDRQPRNAATVNELDLLTLRDALQRMGVFSPDRSVVPYLVEGVQISPFVPSLCNAEPLPGVLRPRNFAVLLFGRQPQRIIPGAFAIYFSYPGIDRTYPVARRFNIPGTLLDRARQIQELVGTEFVTLFDKTNLKSPSLAVNCVLRAHPRFQAEPKPSATAIKKSAAAKKKPHG